ncbi:MAG: hypothetical protein M3437_06595 [Chloroflexota bacterium]|nr:hypothetical protein [Chloroflexota bacterium]MDQ5864912.1 hypothetical protein [Chloroflexota bacterium]
MSLMRGGQARCLIVNCYSNPVGSAVPWATVVATAQEAIAKHDKEAVLQDVSASTVAFSPPNWSYDKALEVEFRYVNPEGYDISITMLDTSPTSTVKIEQRDREEFGKSFYDRAAANKDQYARKLAGVKLSPRQAGELTWERLMEHGDETKRYPRMGLSLDADSPYWYVSYRNVDKGLFEFWDMWFDVDAQSGEIIEVNYEPFATQHEVNQTPATEP